jgi:hypothetical protein
MWVAAQSQTPAIAQSTTPNLSMAPSSDGTEAILSEGTAVTQSTASAAVGDSQSVNIPVIPEVAPYVEAGQSFAAQGDKLSQIGAFLGCGGKYNLQVDSQLQGYGYTFYQQVSNFDIGVFLNGYFDGSSTGYAEMLAVGEAYAAGLVNGTPQAF